MFALFDGQTSIGSLTETGSGLGTFMGNDVLMPAETSNIASLTEMATLTVNNVNSRSGALYISVPANSSVDFNSQAPAPEPASVGMMAAGLAFLGGFSGGARDRQ